MIFEFACYAAAIVSVLAFVGSGRSPRRDRSSSLAVARAKTAKITATASARSTLEMAREIPALSSGEAFEALVAHVEAEPAQAEIEFDDEHDFSADAEPLAPLPDPWDSEEAIAQLADSIEFTSSALALDPAEVAAASAQMDALFGPALAALPGAPAVDEEAIAELLAIPAAPIAARDWDVPVLTLRAIGSLEGLKAWWKWNRKQGLTALNAHYGWAC